MAERNEATSYRESLIWLDDAPLFVDRKKIAQLYDAVIRPGYREEASELSVSERNARQLRGKLGLEGEISPGQIASLIESFLSAKLKASGELDYESQSDEKKIHKVTLSPVDTPARRLKQLTSHYLINHDERIFLMPEFSGDDWRSPSNILAVPRALVFLDFPGLQKAHRSGRPQTKLIPTAAEFEGGSIAPLFAELEGDRGQHPPEYPSEEDHELEPLKEKRKEYWRWFDEQFDPTQAMRVIEEAVSEYGRLQWIDYRVLLTEEGDTLHLHVCPSGEYDTGVFAYNFVKRGFKHGLRLVGTLKSEPDMNVLAIYEK